jgi:hypothetical protein
VRALAGTALGRASLALVAADVLHALDHVRQGRSVGADVYAAGIAGWVALAVLLVLVAGARRLAAPYAFAVGLTFAVGFVLVHLAPHWSAVSDPYSAFRADALSWVLVAVPMVAGVWLCVVAARAIESGGGRVGALPRAE